MLFNQIFEITKTHKNLKINQKQNNVQSNPTLHIILIKVNKRLILYNYIMKYLP